MSSSAIPANPQATLPPPAPPTFTIVDSPPEAFQGRLDDITDRLERDPNSISAKQDLDSLQKNVQDQIETEESKPGGGDPKALEALDKLMVSITETQQDVNAMTSGKKALGENVGSLQP